MKTGRGGAIAGATLLALTLAACGSSSKTSTGTSAAVTTTSSTSTTTTAPSHPRKKSHKPAAKPKKKHTTSHTTTTTTTTTAPTTTSSTTTTTTTHSTTTTSTTTALARPLEATLVGENHDPTIKVKWPYTVTATDAKGHPLSGTIETEFVYGGSVVGKESPFKHTFTDGKIVNQITFPAESVGVALQLQVVVITSVGTKTLDWSVKSKKA
jgi:hypothetical protein